MKQSRWHEFNDMEHLVKQVLANMLWKDCHVECVTLFHSHVDMFMHQHILSDNGTLGKIKEYVICYELQHCGFVHAHIILWVDDNDLDKVTNEIVSFILTIFDETIFKIVPPNDN
jgi:hypothetical protein